jgi:DNA-binding winged helix-turn-helix (wHTH) protein
MEADGFAPVPFPDDVRIGDWLLQPSIDRLSRNGTVVHLRPQLTNLLVLLAHHAGRTVSKEEILSRVWEGHFVAESGMTRCIAEIRQALGDHARDPKIVQTITKRGYRLMAPVVRVEQPAAAELANPPGPEHGGVRHERPALDEAPPEAGSLPRRRPSGAVLAIVASGLVLLALRWGSASRSAAS